MCSQKIGIDLKKTLTGAKLPALPQGAIRLLELSQDVSKGPADFAAPIESDPGLTGQVLRFVNSSYFGFVREISSVKTAIMLVGVRTIKNFVLWNAVFNLSPNPRCGPFDLKCLWQDSLRRGLFARAFAKLLGMKDAEEVFSAGLLQDMAVPLLAKEFPRAYVELLGARCDGRRRLSELEREVFGWTHAEAASIVARQWNLPEHFSTLIEGHLAADRLDPRARPEPRRVAVALSALLPTVADSQWQEADRLDALYNAFRPTRSPSLPQLLAQVDEEFAGFAPVLKLAVPPKSLVDCHVEALATAS